tara:strand:- start:1246 stop:2439 length:1194 start_codon:yes stop_codon:yes gene_type:complete
MAIDPRIAMSVQVPNLQNSIKLFQDTLNSIQNRKMNDQSMAQNEIMYPLQEREANQVLDINTQTIDSNRANQYFKSVADVKPSLDPLIQAGDVDGVMRFLDQRGKQLKQAGLPTETTDEAYRLASSGDLQSIKQGYDSADQIVYANMRNTATTAGQRERQDLLRDSQSSDETIRNSALIGLGINPRAGSSAQERIAGNEELSKAVIKVEGEKEEAKETAKLTAQLKLQPKVAAAVKTAVLLAQSEADRDLSNRSNKRALDVYNVGISGLTSAMDSAYTGTFAATMTALTQSSRVADGAIAAMAPILKSMFRSAGEGNFTDKDQEVLLAMIPTRRDDSDTRKSKLKNIDAIVRAKLAPSEAESPEQNTSNQLTLDDLLNMTEEQINEVPLEVLKKLQK